MSLFAHLRTAAVAAALALLAIGPAAAHEFKSGPIEVVHPWARATPPAAKVGGGYAEIRNDGAEPDRLVSVTAEVAGRVEIHEMGLKDGVMTMRPVEGGVPVPAKGTAALAPGGFHLMMMDLKRPLKAGESFAGTMTFEKAGTIAVTFEVAPIGATGAGMEH
ncbi:copper chaperone PCu(A)C [Inquilinus limosus]|uniref:copper chaperone PCu(A)C n=1 Tax=Inquilinus limosus TaxID=171674 RepID=UPI000691D7A3|nr:copper chaperone PCu(A)C [Inquilinus limosus]